MSFRPSADPASPVPSYQYSSQSGSVTSPGRSISSATTTTPSWADPSSPSSNYTSSCGEYSPGDDSNNDDNHQQGDIQRYKSDVDIVREKYSKERALSLLSSMAESDTRSAGIHHLKSHLDTVRETGASVRALQLLNETSGADVASTFRPEAVSPAAAAAPAAPSGQRCPVQRGAPPLPMSPRTDLPRFVNCIHQEHLAESSRPKRPLTAEDVRDPETVAGMKCPMDIEREERAKRKALYLMRYGCFA